MGLEIRRGRGGELRKHWYGSYVDSNGKRKVISLSEPLPVKHFPGSLRETGDTVFEASRARAQKELSAEAYQSEAVFTGEGATEPTDRRLLSIAQAARALGLSRTTVWRLLRDGRLPFVELRPGSRRIPSAAVTEFARRGAAQ